MTQIKLRRDTSVNFTLKNPILGAGEPAHETDTKKLKIGDGTTAYNDLAYFAGGGGSAEFNVVQPLKLVDGTLTLQIDEQTIQVQDGKLVANLDELGNEVNTLAGDVAGVQADLANKQDKSTAVTTDTKQTISGQKEFNNTLLLLSNNDFLRGQQSTSYRNGAGLSMGSNSTSTDGGVFAPQWKIYNTSGGVDRTETIITTYNQSKLNSANFNAASKLVRLDSDGKLPAIDGSKLTNLPSSSTSEEKHGLEGDYCSKYGIVDCPNGILAKSTGKVTLKAGVVMQMTETDGLTTNASDMAHDITSTADFDLFYTSGSLLEATQVVFSEQEPDNGTTGVLAWYNGTQWQFKSNDTGNVWKAAPAVRLAHIHIISGNITRIDYIGNRHLNEVIPVTVDTEQTISGDKRFTGITTLLNNIKVGTGHYVTTVNGMRLMQFMPGFIGIGTSSIPLTTVDAGDYYLTSRSITAGKGIKITKPESDSLEISSTIGDVKAYVTEEFIDGTEGYRLWSNGRCEQWGYYINNHTDITLLKPMKNNTYFVTGIALQYGVLTLKSQTITSIQIWIGSNPSTEESFYWYLSGESGS